MAKISKISEQLELPTKNGWYWVMIDGYDIPTPCWFSYDESNPEYSYFLPGGMGDSSSTGLYLRDLTKIGPEIEEPTF